MNYLNIALITGMITVVHCCTSDKECSTPGTTCNNQQCTCQKGYLLSTDGTTCLPYVTEYSGECSEDAQCEWLGENSECKYVCKCKEGYRWYDGGCKKYSGLGGTCSDNSDCYDGYNLQSLSCLNNVCGCSEGYYKRGDTDCRKIASEINGTCALDIDCQVPNIDTVCHVGKCIDEKSLPNLTGEPDEEREETRFLYDLYSEKECVTNNDCEDIPNSECYEKTGTCICQKKYFFSEDRTTCIAELGVDVGCKTDNDCVLKPGKCESGVCYCRDYYFVEEGNRKCVKTISEQNWNCLSKEWCYALGQYSFCNSSGTCQCSKVADLQDQHLCIKSRPEDPDMCRDDIECRHIQNGYCVDEACGCRVNYQLQDNVCIPDIGEACVDNTDCQIANSECRDSRCDCIENYVALDNKACYKKISQLEDPCEVDIQCSTVVTYSVCTDSKCLCDENYVPYHNDTCYEKKDYGSYCNNRLECSVSFFGSVDDIVCRNHKCQCPTGFSLEDDNCSSGSTILANFAVLVFVWLLKNVFSIS